jgi:enoyl-CoA hydratase/carnithine racemase
VDRVLTSITDGVGIISLNRPDTHNLLDGATTRALRDAIDWAASHRDVRCVLLRGEGPSFSAGRDDDALDGRADGATDFELVRDAQDVHLRLVDLAKPVVAALKGFVLGSAFELALAADFRVASSDVQFGLPAVRDALVPDGGATTLLTALVGPSRAKYLVMTGRRLGADQARTWGVADWVVRPEDLEQSALDLGRELAAGPPLALAFGKQLVDAAWSTIVRTGIRQERAAQVTLLGSDDHLEARAALVEQRPPKFSGS